MVGNGNPDSGQHPGAADLAATLNAGLQHGGLRSGSARVEQQHNTASDDARQIINNGYIGINKLENHYHESLESRKASERDEIIDWLVGGRSNVLQQSAIFNEAWASREDETGSWLLEDEGFEQWCAGVRRTLWLHGGVGCGKTVLTTFVVQNLRQILGTSRVFHYHCSFRHASSRKSQFLLRLLLAQICLQAVPQAARDLYNDWCRTNPWHSYGTDGDGDIVIKDRKLKDAFGRSIVEYHDLLQHGMEDSQCPPDASISVNHSCLYIVVDALDELDTDQVRPALDLLQSLPQVDFVQLLCTSRTQPKIEKVLLKLAHWPAIEVSKHRVSKDLEAFISNTIDNSDLADCSPAMKLEIKTTLLVKGEGMFKWVSLQLRHLQTLLVQNDDALRLELRSLPEDLHDTYERSLERIELSQRGKAVRALQWLAFAKRALRMSELVEACSIREDLRHTSDLVASGRLRPEDLHNLISDLIILETPESTNVTLNQRTVTLAHASVQDFLIGSRSSEENHIVKDPYFAKSHGKVDVVEVRLGEACLAFLYSHNVRGVDLATHPFLQYAWFHWDEHLQKNSQQNGVTGQNFFRTQAIKMFESFAKEPYPHLQWLVNGDCNPNPDDPGVVKLLEALDTPYFYAGFGSFQPHPQTSQSTERSVYQHGPLEDPSSEIRLLEILPRLSNTDSTLCRIEAFTLTEAPPFDAVSYFWGRFSPDYTIYLNGAPVILTRRLNNILESLKFRSESKGGHLWVDFTCINQVDHDENRQQIFLMRDIFASARQVLVAFGELEVGDDVGVSNVVYVAKELVNASEDRRRELRRFVLEPNNRILQLFRKPYWTRQWIIQEIVVARQPTILVGEHALNVEHLEALYSLFRSLIESPTLRMARASVDEIPPLQAICAIMHTRHELRVRDHCDFFELFLRFRNSQVTYHADKFYGIWGLIENGFFDVPIGHDIEIQNLWIRATVSCIWRNKSLAVLSYHPTRHTDEHDELPSWSMRFEGFRPDVASFLAGAAAYEGLFQAGGCTTTSNPLLKQFGPADRSRVYYAMAFQGAYIARLTEKLTVTSDDWGVERCRDTLSRINSAHRPPECLELNAEQLKREIRWRTVLADQYPPGKRLQPFQCEDWVFPPTSLEQELQLLDFWQNLDTNFLAGRSLFIAEDGRLILGPDTAEIGDEVVILLGGRVPFCLRNVGDKMHILLGECYVQGIMDGECMHDPSLEILEYRVF